MTNSRLIEDATHKLATVGGRYRGGVEVHGAVAFGDLFFAEFEEEVAHGEGNEVHEERYRHHVHHLRG